MKTVDSPLWSGVLEPYEDSPSSFSDRVSIERSPRTGVAEFMTEAEPRHIAVIGGGFSGTLTAINLARLAESPLRITVINCRYPLHRGIAYSTTRPEHLLNVAARNMSALPDHPNHFVEWLRTHAEHADTPDAELREAFMPRRVYGDYLRALSLHYTRPIDHHSPATIATIEDEAVALRPRGRGVEISLAGGALVSADKVVLATGNEPPAELPGSETLMTHPAWCSNPWTRWEKNLPDPSESIVLLGTGLTTVDAIITLLALDWRGTIHAVSRNGSLPMSHFKGVEDPHFPPPEIDLAKLGLAGLLTLVEEHCERLRQIGANPAMIVDKMRPHTQRVWQSFTAAERREFVSRHSGRWNIFRHRIAPTIHQQITQAVEQGRLQISRGAIARVESRGTRIGVEIRARDDSSSWIEAGLAINCTGPHTRFSATRSPLLQQLMSSGAAQPDAMDMGIRVEADYAVVERNGRRSPYLFAVGPLLRGTLWESIAVPELRGQTLRVAQTLIDEIPSTTPGAGHWVVADESAVLEYQI